MGVITGNNGYRDPDDPYRSGLWWRIWSIVQMIQLGKSVWRAIIDGLFN